MNNEIRYNRDIGLFTFDRAKTSCKWRTKFCNEKCYNVKLYKKFKRMDGKDIRNEEFWKNADVSYFSNAIKEKLKQRNRFRFCSRGEIFDTINNAKKVKEIIENNKDILFHIPTRAWRNNELRKYIEDNLLDIPNAFILASIDPSNSKEELNKLDKWRTMFFGNDEVSPFNANKCIKTWGDVKKACNTCSDGCFNKNIKHVWLKSH